MRETTAKHHLKAQYIKGAFQVGVPAPQVFGCMGGSTSGCACWLQHIEGSCMTLHVCASAGKGSWCCPREQSWLQQQGKVNGNATVLGVMAMVGALKTVSIL